jgi:hypothetical protein
MGYFLGAIGFLIIMFNWYTRYHLWFVVAKMTQEERDKKLGEPFIPIIGGLLIAIALAQFDVPAWVCFLPFVIDYGGLFGVGTFIYAIATGAFSKTPPKTDSIVLGSVSMLEERILHTIEDLFVSIRFSAWQKDDNLLKDSLPIIEEKRALVNHFGNALQKMIFTYCFDNLKVSIESQQYEFTADFADAVHNLPEIFYKEYNLSSYWKVYIKPLRNKHGTHLFDDFKNIFKGDSSSILIKNRK